MMRKKVVLILLLLGGLWSLPGADRLLAQGELSFRDTRRDFWVGQNTSSITLGDFNGDGLPDLATANRNSLAVSVLLGRGDGTFAAAQDFTVGVSPSGIAAGDFNGDSRVDLAVTIASGTVSILLGRGDGTFEAAQNFGVGRHPGPAAAGDFNGDGRLDLAVVSQEEGSVAILLNETNNPQ